MYNTQPLKQKAARAYGARNQKDMIRPLQRPIFFSSHSSGWKKARAAKKKKDRKI